MWLISFIFFVGLITQLIGSAINGRVVSFPLNASEDETKQQIWNLFPALKQTPFDYMRVDSRRNLCLLPSNMTTPAAWKDSRILGRSALYIRPKSAICQVRMLHGKLFDFDQHNNNYPHLDKFVGSRLVGVTSFKNLPGSLSRRLPSINLKSLCCLFVYETSSRALNTHFWWIIIKGIPIRRHHTCSDFLTWYLALNT